MAQAMLMRRGSGVIKPRLVSGLAQPANPKINTIWVNTSIVLTGRYALSDSAPSAINGTAPQTGDLWLKTGGGIYPIFDGITVPVCLVSVYIGSWVSKTSYYYNGSWQTICLMLLNGTNKHNEHHGGWNRYRSYTGEAYETSTGLYFGYNNVDTSNAAAGFQTVNPINLSGFTSLIFEVAVTSTITTCYVGAGSTLMASICKNDMTVNGSNNADGNIYTQYFPHTGTGTKTLTVNVGGVSAARYIGFGGKGKGTVTRIYLI